MAETIGFVQSIQWSRDPPTACVCVGPSPGDSELLLVHVDGHEAQLAFRASMITGLTRALLSGQEVHVVHGETDPDIVDLTVGGS
jgi:hypothetical protein